VNLVVRSFNACQRQLLANVGCESWNAELRCLLHVHSRALILVREQDFGSNEVNMERDVWLEEVRKLLPDMRR
jgi:hypothetical protein